jgi:hypothetical protein
VMRNPMLPVSLAVISIPRAAVTLRFDVKKRHRRAGTESDVLSVASFLCNVAGSIDANH